MFSKIKHNFNSWFIIDFNYILKECYNNIIIHDNTIQHNKLSKLLFDKIKKIILEIIDRNYNNKNIIIVYDNKLELYKDYYNLIESYIINFFNEYEFIFYNNNKYNNIDIIAIITNVIIKKYNDSIRIISNNTILYQLINDKILILDINCKEDTIHIFSSGKVNLWYNIINGSETKLKFNNNFISKFIKPDNDILETLSDQDEYRYLSNRELYLFLHKINLLENILTKYPNIVLNQQHIKNQSLVDFSKIPLYIVNEIETEFWKLYKKEDEFIYYKNKSHHKKYCNSNNFCKKTYIKKHTNNSIHKNNNTFNNNRFILLDIDNI